jgi:hypothetical protein
MSKTTEAIIIKGMNNSPFLATLNMEDYYVFTDYKLWKRTCREAHRWSENFSFKAVINNELKYIIKR